MHRNVDDDALCPEFRHVALLRHPVERVRRQLERMSPTPNVRLRETLSSPFVFNMSERTSLMGTPAVNNYLARLLLGSAAFFLPLRAVNDSHCDVASALLARFDAVVPLDQVRLPPTGTGAVLVAAHKLVQLRHVVRRYLLRRTIVSRLVNTHVTFPFPSSSWTREVRPTSRIG